MIVLICGCLILFLNNGSRQSFGLYLGPISRDLGLDFQIFSLSIAIQNLLIGIGQPFTGAIADRFGTARTIFVCGLLYVFGLVMLATADTAMDLHLGGGILIGIASSGTSFAIVLGAITRVVSPERRSIALGIATAAASLAQLIMAPINQELISDLGWSAALLIVAMLTGAIVPLASALTGRARDAVDPLTESQTLTQALAQASKHSSYLFLTAGFFVCGFQVMFITSHFPNFLAQHGKAELAGWTIGVIGFCNFFGTFLSGYLGGRYSKKYLLSGLYFSRSVVFALFLLTPISTFSILAFGAAIGFLWLGTVPLTGGLVAAMFGVRYMTTLYSIVFMSHQFGSFLGAWMGGVVFDATGSYDIMWMIAIALGILAALLHLPISDQRVQQSARS